MLYGLQQMAAAGVKYALVAHFGDHEIARSFYRSLGFQPWHLQNGYTKPLPG